jgi:hypothetical protein
MAEQPEDRGLILRRTIYLHRGEPGLRALSELLQIGTLDFNRLLRDWPDSDGFRIVQGKAQYAHSLLSHIDTPPEEDVLSAAMKRNREDQE